METERPGTTLAEPGAPAGGDRPEMLGDLWRRFDMSASETSTTRDIARESRHAEPAASLRAYRNEQQGE